MTFSRSRWLNWGAIAAVVFAVFNIFFWPGPDGIALVKIGTSSTTVHIDTTLLGLNAERAASVFQPGKSLKATIDKTYSTTFVLEKVEELSNTVAATQRNGTVKARPDPRPEMGYSKNLLLTFKVPGYANDSGTYVGLKPIRTGSSIKIIGDDFETQATVVSTRTD
jgi:hypothetical protein